MVESGQADFAKTAIGYAQAGWAVFPAHSIRGGVCTCSKTASCDKPGKHPLGALVPHGVNEASKQESQIRAWWKARPWANIAGACGGISGRDVLDVDDEIGRETLRALEAQYGPLPTTPRQLSGGGGEHLLFASNGTPLPNRVRFAPGLDVRSSGGYIILAPSLHISGRSYHWDLEFDPEDVPLAPMSHWLTELILKAHQKGERHRLDTAAALAGVPEGERDATLFRLACKLRMADVPFEIAEQLLIDAAPKCVPPFPEDVARQKVRRAYQNYPPGAGHGRTNQAKADAPVIDVGNDHEAHETELGFAMRIVEHHGRDLHFCFPWKKWLVWDGQRWAEDRTGKACFLAKETIRALQREALEIDDRDERKKRLDFTLKCEKESCIRAALNLARSEPGIAVTPEQLNRDTWMLNVANGALDLRTGVLTPPRREDLITKLCPTPFEPEASSPLWERFLLRIMDTNLEMVFYLQRLAGYSVTGVCREHLLIMLIGQGANGKSTFTNAVFHVLGPDYATLLAPNLLFESGKDAHPTALADLYGKRFGFTHELDAGTRLAEGRVKQITGGDRMKARRMREDFWEFDPTHTLFLCANSRPVIRGTDEGIWRRVRLVPFTVQIPEEERDTTLGAKLQDAAPAILKWITSGARDWQELGLSDPSEVTQATSEFREDSDVLAQFFAARCVIHPDVFVSAKVIYEAYDRWHRENVGATPISQKTFGGCLRDRNVAKDRKATAGAVRYRGIALRVDE